MNKLLLQDLKNNKDMYDHELAYIEAVCQYIDSNMEGIPESQVTISNYTSKMYELVQSIIDCKTGIPAIDNIADYRKQSAFDETKASLGDEDFSELINSTDFSTSNHRYKYVRNYIAVISSNGGLFGYTFDALTNGNNYSDGSKKNTI